jgi:predicted nuclease with RNAse H fold
MIVGIDLAGSEKRPTGFCILHDLNSKCCILYTDREILENVQKVKPKVIAIDAPLSLPKGRKSLEEKCNIHLRKCDKELISMKIKFFPITLGPMRMLTKRGIRLRRILEKKGFKVIEVYPGAAQDIWKIPRKQKGLEKLRRGLMRLGVKGDISKNDITGDELDAITSALVGKAYLEGKYLAIGDPEEGLIILPKTNFTCGKEKACTHTFSLKRES